MPQPRTIVVVPTYNEAENIPILVEKLHGLGLALDVLFVDDKSPDGTGEVAERVREAHPEVRVMHREGPKGFGFAVVDGLKWALGEGYELVCTMDADLSHDPDLVPTLIEAVMGGADISIGSRYVPGGGMIVDWGPARRAVSTMGNAYIRLMLGLGVKDSTTNFRCYRRGLLETAELDEAASSGYSVLPELLFRMRRNGKYSVVEVPTVYVQRKLGKSKISWKIVFESLLRTTSWGVTRMVSGFPSGEARREAA